MLLTRIFIFKLAFVSTLVHAQKSSPDFFSEGVALLQSQKLNEAQASFEKSLERNPENPNILFNLGLSHYRQGHKGWAAACWRKALNLRPQMASARRALEIVEHELPQSLNEDGNMLAQLQKQIAVRPSWKLYLLVMWLGMIVSGWLWLRYFGGRKRSQLNQTEAPDFPTMPFLVSIFTLLVLCLVVLKFSEDQQVRATVVETTASLHLSPDASAPQLTELFQGTEVDVIRKYKDWVQVSVPSGSTGWLAKNTIFQTSGQPIW